MRGLLLRRLGRLFCVVVILSVAVPASGAPSQRAIACQGNVRSGRQAACHASISIPHFNARDRIDYSTLVAKLASPSASNWRVSATLADARGVVYFAWYCSAARSSVSGPNTTYVGRSCEATRKMVRVRRNGRTYWTYYTADTSRPQRLRVTAQNDACAPTSIRGCRFVAKATYVLA